jgi:serine/threonine protein kinase
MTTKVGADGTIKRRPAPNAAVRLAGLGLVPVRPPAAVSPPPPDVLPYLPPERVDGAAYGPRGDLYGLGTLLYYLLTGRPPFAAASSAELLHKIRSAAPAPLAALRPDVPADLSALVHVLLNKRPEDRPPTAFDAEQVLVRFCRPGTVPVPAPAGPIPAAPPAFVAYPAAGPAPEAQPAPADEWGAETDFSAAHADHTPAPRRKLSAKDKARGRLMIALGLLLHLSAVAVFLLIFVFNVFDSSPEPAKSHTPSDPTPKKPAPKKPKLQTPNP